MNTKILSIILLLTTSCAVKIHHAILPANINGLDVYQIQCPYSKALHNEKFDLPQEKTCMTKIKNFCISGYKIIERHQGISKIKSAVMFVTFTCDNKPVVFESNDIETEEANKGWTEYIPFLD